MIPICFCKPRREPCPECSAFDWSRTDKLKPNGDAENHRILGERLRPAQEETR